MLDSVAKSFAIKDLSLCRTDAVDLTTEKFLIYGRQTILLEALIRFDWTNMNIARNTFSLKLKSFDVPFKANSSCSSISASSSYCAAYFLFDFWFFLGFLESF